MIEWADELWPYVNGKALMSGLNLREMEASNMLDVIHFIMEEDWTFSTPEQAEVQSDVRSAIFEKLYGKVYPYKLPKRDKNGRPSTNRASDNTFTSPTSNVDDLDMEKPFNPREMPVKPYTPPTSFNPDSAMPFEGLDAPLG